MLFENVQHILVYVHSVFLHEIKPCRFVQNRQKFKKRVSTYECELIPRNIQCWPNY